MLVNAATAAIPNIGWYAPTKRLIVEARMEESSWISMPDVRRMKTKLVLMGEGGVGKTSLVRRFVLNEYQDTYLHTVGTRVNKIELTIPHGADTEVQMDMAIFDIMGQKGFRDLVRETYYHGAQALMAVCDLTQKDSLSALDDWIPRALEIRGCTLVSGREQEGLGSPESLLGRGDSPGRGNLRRTVCPDIGSDGRVRRGRVQCPRHRNGHSGVSSRGHASGGARLASEGSRPSGQTRFDRVEETAVLRDSARREGRRAPGGARPPRAGGLGNDPLVRCVRFCRDNHPARRESGEAVLRMGGVIRRRGGPGHEEGAAGANPAVVGAGEDSVSIDGTISDARRDRGRGDPICSRSERYRRSLRRRLGLRERRPRDCRETVGGGPRSGR